MADDIFLTPEEQDERAKKWLKDNGLSIAVGISLGLAGVFGYNQYQSNVQLKAEQASALYGKVVETDGASQISDIGDQVQALKKDYASSSYTAKAALINAKQLAVSDQQAAISELQWVIDNAPEVGLQHAARVRLAKLHLVAGNFEDAKKLASVQTTNGFDSHYQEILGDIERKQGNIEAARSHYEKATESLGTAGRTYASVLTMKLNRLPQDDAVDQDAVDQDVSSVTVETGQNESAAVVENAEINEAAAEVQAVTRDDVDAQADTE